MKYIVELPATPVPITLLSVSESLQILGCLSCLARWRDPLPYLFLIFQIGFVGVPLVDGFSDDEPLDVDGADLASSPAGLRYITLLLNLNQTKTKRWLYLWYGITNNKISIDVIALSKFLNQIMTNLVINQFNWLIKFL